MSIFKEAKDLVSRPGSQFHWVKLLIGLAGVIALSFGFAAILNLAKSKLDINLFEHNYVAYLSVFVATLLSNLTIVAPVPFAVAIMINAATDFNPILVALCAASGGTLGELSGYFAGRLGKKMAVPDSLIGYQRLESWIRNHGFWTIMAIAFQPVIPFDLGGILAGAAKMPLHTFVPALWLGKFPKYLLLTYAGMGIIRFLPPWLAG